jgi:hypothetical protein
MKTLLALYFLLAVAPVCASILDAASKVPDTDEKIVRVDHRDLQAMVKSFRVDVRPEFVLLLMKDIDDKAVIALVPHSRTGKYPQNLIGQQAVQWQKLAIHARDVISMDKLLGEGPVELRHNSRAALGVTKKKLTSQIFVARRLEINPVSYQSLVEYMRANPLNLPGARSSHFSNLVTLLFGQAHIRIFGKGGGVNAFEASRDLLQDNNFLKPGKTKVMHVHGELFHGELTISANSRYTGHLAPGRYFVLGRLSSGLKNLNILDRRQREQSNSIAIGLLVFRDRKTPEVPGVLFLQDSLAPVHNSRLSDFQFTNNPGFAFKPTSIREFFEQGFTIGGVGIASFFNRRDSARGVQGNFRSTYGMASTGVELSRGAKVLAPRYLSLALAEGQRSGGVRVTDTITSGATSFVLHSSEDSRKWSRLGELKSLTWLGFDSHELSFPHGLSGTIDPQTLRPSSSVVGIRGLQIPNSMKRL